VCGCKSSRRKGGEHELNVLDDKPFEQLLRNFVQVLCHWRTFSNIWAIFTKFGKNMVPLKVTPVPYCFNLLKSVLTKWWTRELVKREQRQRPWRDCLEMMYGSGYWKNMNHLLGHRFFLIERKIKRCRPCEIISCLSALWRLLIICSSLARGILYRDISKVAPHYMCQQSQTWRGYEAFKL